MSYVRKVFEAAARYHFKRQQGGEREVLEERGIARAARI